MLKTKAYKFILKVRKFQLPTVYHFSTAEGETWLWVDSAPLPGLMVKEEFLRLFGKFFPTPGNSAIIFAPGQGN